VFLRGRKFANTAFISKSIAHPCGAFIIDLKETPGCSINDPSQRQVSLPHSLYYSNIPRPLPLTISCLSFLRLAIGTLKKHIEEKRLSSDVIMK
jgi:hypothetical protein